MKIVGIAACPAGLAHTPMAAKALWFKNGAARKYGSGQQDYWGRG